MVREGIIVCVNVLDANRSTPFPTPRKRGPTVNVYEARYQIKGLVLYRIEERYRRIIGVFLSFLPCVYFDGCLEQQDIFIDGIPNLEVMMA